MFNSAREFTIPGLLAVAQLVTWPIQAIAEPGLQDRPVNTTCVAPDRPASSSPVSFETLASISEPTYMVEDHLGRWFVVTLAGVVKLFDGSADFAEIGTALDITDRVVTTRNGQPAEFGALGIALDPDFPNNGYVYIYYTANPSSYEARLSRFTSVDGTTIDASSELVLLSLPLITGVHVGGTVAFGPDGYLYLGVGNNGSNSNSQNTFSLMGKMLRVDVSSRLPYEIPSDNPFADGQAGAPEVYAWGLRNPFRWSFDSATGDLWLGDVGQDAWEEVDVIVNGGNYGWPIREGAHCLNGAQCDATGLIDPVFDYPHQPGLNSVIGGVIYHGSAMPALRGAYIFGDLYAAFFSLTADMQGGLVRQELTDSGGMFAFAEGSDGEIYVARAANGTIQRIAPAGVVSPDNFPQRLSATGCVDPADATRPSSALIPYDVIAPLWSDAAQKDRYMALPDGKTIHINLADDWEFPVGTVLVKHFRLNGSWVETRLFMRHDDGDWGGYSYEWNDEQTDAFLLAGAKNKQVGNQTWRFPSRGECFQCHTQAAGRALGPETAQLNTGLTYEATSTTANQIETLAHIGAFDADPGSPASLPALTNPYAPGRIHSRARAYLHANCSHCHRPGGSGLGPADFRYQVPDSDLGVINVSPTSGDFGISNAALLFPDHPEKSILSFRMKSLGLPRMPPLATSIVDEQATQLIDAWINSVGNRAPQVLEPLPDLTLTEGVSFQFDVSSHFTDPDSDPLEFIATGVPAGISIQPATAQLSGIPETGTSSSGLFVVTITATDPYGASVVAQSAMTVVVRTPDLTPAPGTDTGTAAATGGGAVDPVGLGILLKLVLWARRSRFRALRDL